ncbi:MAG: glycosyltransferase [Moorea sp. SIO4G2]|nr:glycosyltransferase [Moorena sp. SIO4G2]
MQSKKKLPDQLSKQGIVSKKNSPRVSIGLVVYNGENFIRKAIDSILAQIFKDFELIISDNASTDQTEASSNSSKSCHSTLFDSKPCPQYQGCS